MALRLGVIGAGIMGANHVRLAKVVAGVELVAVVDSDLERVDALIGSDEDVAAFTDVDAFLESGLAEAVVIAVPTLFHHDIASKALGAGLHALVEKPISSTTEQAAELIELAAANGRVLMVGHVERFNPTIMELARFVKDPVHIQAERVSPFSERVKDSVVLDLMIHDLDIVQMLVGSPVVDISGVGRSVRTSVVDLASVHLMFANGTTATITASRLGQHKVRQIQVTGPESHISADLLRQDIAINKVAHVEYVAEGGARYRQTGVVEIPFIENRGEPLALELAEFAAAIAEGRPAVVDGQAGLAALELVQRVHDVIRVGA